MIIRKSNVLVIAAVLALTTRVARAQAVLDQSYDPTGNVTVNAGFGGIDTNQERAQTFTVGITGQLTKVNVFVKTFGAGGNMICDIRVTVLGAPDPQITPLGVLATATVPTSAIPGGGGGFVTFTLSTPVAVTAGQVFAICLHADAAAPIFGWLGENTNPYPGGGSYERVIGNHNWVPDGPVYDLGFQTFVIPGSPPTPGVTITQSGGSTNVTEGGATDTYTLVLNTAPTANVTISINPGSQVTVSPATLTFTPANWNVSQTVTVTAVDDTLVEGPHTGTITHTASSADASYNGIAIVSITVNIIDNDSGPSGGGSSSGGEGKFTGGGGSEGGSGSSGSSGGSGEGGFGGGGGRALAPNRGDSVLALFLVRHGSRNLLPIRPQPGYVPPPGASLTVRHLPPRPQPTTEDAIAEGQEENSSNWPGAIFLAIFCLGLVVAGGRISGIV